MSNLIQPLTATVLSGAAAAARPLLIAVIAPADSPALAELPTRSDATMFVIGNSVADFGEQLVDADALLIIPPGDVSILTEVFDKAPGLRWVHGFFAGVDSLADFTRERLLEGRGAAIPLTNGRGAFSDSLAEYSMAACLHFNKQLPRCRSNLAAARWEKFEMNVLAGKTVAYLGWGHIARTSARLAKAFRMNVVALRRDASKTEPELCDVMRSSASDEDKALTFAEADFVISALPGTPETIDFVGAAEFAAMKPSGVFISLGRGLVVDEEALGEALRAGSIAGAALDVFKKEPLPAASQLWGIDPDRLLLTAHNADYTDDYFRLGWSVWKENLDALLSGASADEMATVVNKKAGY